MKNCRTCSNPRRSDDCQEDACPYLAGILGYNANTDRFGLLVMDLWEIDGIGLGQPMEVLIDGTWKKPAWICVMTERLADEVYGVWKALYTKSMACIRSTWRELLFDSTYDIHTFYKTKKQPFLGCFFTSCAHNWQWLYLLCYVPKQY